MISVLQTYWKRTELQLAIIVLAMLLLTFWSYSFAADGKRAAVIADGDLAACQTMAPQIRSLRNTPLMAQAQALQQPDLNQRIERAATAAGFGPGSIDRISPDEPRRLPDSVYKEVPVQVPVRGVTLRQLALFLHRLTQDPAASGEANTGKQGGSGTLRVHAIRLVAPRGEETGDRWRAEITLTYLIYAPAVSVGRERP
jgi:hypothetical protein